MISQNSTAKNHHELKPSGTQLYRRGEDMQGSQVLPSVDGQEPVSPTGWQRQSKESLHEQQPSIHGLRGSQGPQTL